MLALLDRERVPAPLVNTQVELSSSTRFEVDLYWPTWSLVVELDGSAHSRPPAQRRDHARATALRRHGITVLRFTWRDVETTPRQTIDSIRHAAALACPARRR
jgi:very-short-patch-repair endonuclease